MHLYSQELFVITAPPATGKTYWIERFREASKFTTLLVISPLRALADECRMKWGDDIIVMTPEEWLGKKPISEIVIFDEFHLYFYWGDSFRPTMWEAFYEITSSARMTFFLTATLSPEMVSEIKTYTCQFEKICWLDHGNRALRFDPELYVRAPSKNWIFNQIESEASGVNLIFVKYRNEVKALEKKLTLKGFKCISCIGGESKYMAQKLSLSPEPDFIISTTVLSHGVNLPKIKKIYFTYQVKNIDFWIQMVARGGRKGERYQVIALEKPFTLKWNPFKNLFWVFLLTIRQKYMKMRHAF